MAEPASLNIYSLMGKFSITFSPVPVPVPVAERSSRPQALDTTARSRSGTGDNTPVDRSPLQRVSSASSSTNRSVGTSILQTGRNSTTSLDGRPRGLSTRMSEEDRQREFDSLVKGDETVKFTLTPQNVRDVAVSRSSCCFDLLFFSH